MVIVGIGSNLTSEKNENPLQNCQRAVEGLTAHGLNIQARSHWYESAPVPASDQPWFVNGVVKIGTGLGPHKLLKMLLGLEDELGRKRSIPNAARIIDLDLLAYDQICLETDNMILPHPRLHERAFVLLPLADIAPAWIHPRTGESLDEMGKNIGKDQEIRRID